MARPVGIDLGTTYSVAAYLDDSGRPVTMRNAEGDLTTPSVVLFDGDDVVVGKEAVKAIAREAEHVAQCAKRDMGQRAYPKRIGGRSLPPEVIQAYVLRKIKDDASRAIGDFRQAVITVPAYFDEVRRKATYDAAYMAGLDVLDIVNEPTAAALACGVESSLLAPDGSSAETQTLLVYDLGGGTFDVTVMQIEGKEFTTLATDGDVHLGGRDWDQRLMDIVAEQFDNEHGFDPRIAPNYCGALWRECEDAKRTLSARREAVVTCDFRGCGLPVRVSRSEFEERTADLLERTEFTAREVLKAARLDWGSIDRILLVGGSTRMPMVAEMLQRVSGKKADRAPSPDEVVAHGAAIHAGLLIDRGSGRRPQLQVHNVNSHSLGVVAIEPKTGERQTAVLIPRNTRLPVQTKRRFRTKKDGQTSVWVHIVEGESPVPAHCTQIGRCAVEHLPPNLPAGTPIEVKFAYNGSGRLLVGVAVSGTGKRMKHEILRENGLPQEQLNGWRLRITGE